ncbi:MAG: DNA cytosine methyltransferase [Opitutales bacterium]
MNTIKSLEVFSGAGGLATGLWECGASHSALVEWNNHACNTLIANHGWDVVHNADASKFDFSKYDVDIVAGGPPCQPFSLAGKHQGSMDTRDMFPHACRAISECAPKAFIFENVKGLLRKSFSSYFEYILLRLSYPEIIKKENENWEDHLRRLERHHTSGSKSGLCYRVVFRLVDAADYGVPQRRERVVIVGIREDLGVEWSFPKPTYSFESLIWDQFVGGEYWNRHDVKKPDTSCYDQRISELIQKAEKQHGFFPPELKPWKTVRDQLADIPEPDVEGSFSPEHVIRNGARSYPGHTGSFIDLPSKTLKAGDHGVPGGENMIRFHDGSVRYFTTYEAKRIQTFPKNYKITGSWTEGMRQVGNAVPVRLGRVVGKSVIESVWRKTECTTRRWGHQLTPQLT